MPPSPLAAGTTYSVLEGVPDGQGGHRYRLGNPASSSPNTPIAFADGRYVRTYVLERFPEEAVAAVKLRHAKERRALSVSSAVVEIDGLEFDASLDSIYRMNAVLFAAQLDAKPDSAVVRWVMSNNVVREVSLRQLRAAYVQAVERLVYDWPEVYTELNK